MRTAVVVMARNQHRQPENMARKNKAAAWEAWATMAEVMGMMGGMKHGSGDQKGGGQGMGGMMGMGGGMGMMGV